MKLKLLSTLLVVVLIASTAWADQIILKNGTEYSGKFIRGDSNVIEFRILGRIESFKTADVSQVTFKEPELTSPPSSSTIRQVPPENPPREELRAASSVQSPPSPVSSGELTLPSGTPVVIRMTTAVDTDRNRVGDKFDAVLEDPLTIGNEIVAERGSTVTGTIAYAQESGRLSGKSELALELTGINIRGKNYPLRTSDYMEVGTSRGKKTAATVGGGAALGAIIGAIAGGGKGAAVGAATGAGVGAGVQILTKGQTLKIPVETVLEFRLQSPLNVQSR